MVQAREEELIDYPVIRYVSEKDSFVDDHKYTSMECYLDIYLNGKRFTTSFCSPGDHTDLVIGILAQMGQIRTYDDIVRMDIDEETLQAAVVTTAEAQAWAAGNATDPRYFRAREILDCEPEKIFERPRDVRFKAGDILACADKLLAELAATHEKTNGVHSGIIWDQQAEKILVFREDIGRHNALDKAVGRALIDGVDLRQCVLFSSGRIPADMMEKAIRAGVPLLASNAVPTDRAVALARAYRVVLICTARSDSMNIFADKYLWGT